MPPEPQLRLRHAVRVLTAAGRLEDRVFRGGPPLDRSLQAYQRSRPNMGRNDRLLLGTAVYALARNRSLYHRVLSDETPGSGLFLLLALLDRVTDTSSVAAVPHLPGGVRPWRDAMDRAALLRNEWKRTLEGASEDRVGNLSSGAADAFASLFSIPEWWLREGPWELLSDALREVSALKHPQGLTLRVQIHRSTREAVFSGLAGLGIRSAATARSPWGIRVEQRHNVLATVFFHDGVIEVQDEGSQLVACLCDPKPGEKILDLCAGGGGKALALASAMGGRGVVIAYDPDSGRLRDTRRRARRAGLANVRPVEDLDEARRLGPYDLVLADVPCSSSGTLRRNPDVAWRWAEGDVSRLVALQREILDRGAQLVRPGGYLVYSTCSLFERENGLQVRWLLRTRPELSLAPPGERRGHLPLLDIPASESGAFRLPADLPSYDGDAFFLARLRRT